MRAISTIAFLLAATGLAPSPMAQGLPRCGADTSGLVACVGGTLCACAFANGGTMTAEPAGYRWDCGLLQPMCPPEQSILPYQGPLPEAIQLDQVGSPRDDRYGPDPRSADAPPRAMPPGPLDRW